MAATTFSKFPELAPEIRELDLAIGGSKAQSLHVQDTVESRRIAMSLTQYVRKTCSTG
jgi:hypothetical protein